MRKRSRTKSWLRAHIKHKVALWLLAAATLAVAGVFYIQRESKPAKAVYGNFEYRKGAGLTNEKRPVASTEFTVDEYAYVTDPNRPESVLVSGNQPYQIFIFNNTNATDPTTFLWTGKTDAAGGVAIDNWSYNAGTGLWQWNTVWFVVCSANTKCDARVNNISYDNGQPSQYVRVWFNTASGQLRTDYVQWIHAYAYYSQTGFQFYNDDGNFTGAPNTKNTSQTPLNTSRTGASAAQLGELMTIKIHNESLGMSSSYDNNLSRYPYFRLEYREGSGSWLPVTGATPIAWALGLSNNVAADSKWGVDMGTSVPDACQHPIWTTGWASSRDNWQEGSSRVSSQFNYGSTGPPVCYLTSFVIKVNENASPGQTYTLRTTIPDYIDSAGNKYSHTPAILDNYLMEPAIEIKNGANDNTSLYSKYASPTVPETAVGAWYPETYQGYLPFTNTKVLPAVDANNIPHLLMRTTAADLVHLWYTPQQDGGVGCPTGQGNGWWNCETIETGVATDVKMTDARFENGKLRVVYKKGTDVRYAEYVGTGGGGCTGATYPLAWRCVTVLSGLAAGAGPYELGVKLNGTVAIVLQENTISYCEGKIVSGAWSSTRPCLRDFLLPGSNPALGIYKISGLPNDGLPRIAYFTTDLNSKLVLTLAYCSERTQEDSCLVLTNWSPNPPNSGVYQIDDLLTNISFQRPPSIKVDSDGKVHIAWTDYVTGYVFYARESISGDTGGCRYNGTTTTAGWHCEWITNGPANNGSAVDLELTPMGERVRIVAASQAYNSSFLVNGVNDYISAVDIDGVSKPYSLFDDENYCYNNNGAVGNYSGLWKLRNTGGWICEQPQATRSYTALANLNLAFDNDGQPIVTSGLNDSAVRFSWARRPLQYPFDLNGMFNVSQQDGFYESISNSSSSYPTQFLFEHIYNFNNTSPSANWLGKSTLAPTTQPVKLQIYRFGTKQQWELVKQDNTTAAGTDFYLNSSGWMPPSPVSDYYQSLGGGKYKVYWRVIQGDSASAYTLSTNLWGANGPGTLKVEARLATTAALITNSSVKFNVYGATPLLNQETQTTGPDAGSWKASVGQGSYEIRILADPVGYYLNVGASQRSGNVISGNTTTLILYYWTQSPSTANTQTVTTNQDTPKTITLTGTDLNALEPGGVILPITIDATASTTSGAYPGTGSTVVFIDRYNGYAFGPDSGFYVCSYYRTTNGGENWASVSLATDCRRVVVWYDGWTPTSFYINYIHIAVFNNSANRVDYYRLHPKDPSNNFNDTLVGPIATPSPGGLTNAGFHSITRATDGTIYVMVSEDSTSGGKGTHFYKSTDVGMTWSATDFVGGAYGFPFGSPNDNTTARRPQIVPTINGQIVAIGYRHVSSTAGELMANVWFWDGATWRWGNSTEPDFPQNIQKSLDNAAISVSFKEEDQTNFEGGFNATVDKNGTIYLAYINDQDDAGANDTVRVLRYKPIGGGWDPVDPTTNSPQLVRTSTECSGTPTYCGIDDVAIAVAEGGSYGGQNYGDYIYVAFTRRVTGLTDSAQIVLKRSKLSTTGSSLGGWLEMKDASTQALIATQGRYRGLSMNARSDSRLFVVAKIDSTDDLIGRTAALLPCRTNFSITSTSFGDLATAVSPMSGLANCVGTMLMADVTYTPATGFADDVSPYDNFFFKFNNGIGDSNLAKVDIKVIPVPTVTVTRNAASNNPGDILLSATVDFDSVTPSSCPVTGVYDTSYGGSPCLFKSITKNAILTITSAMPASTTATWTGCRADSPSNGCKVGPLTTNVTVGVTFTTTLRLDIIVQGTNASGTVTAGTDISCVLASGVQSGDCFEEYTGAAPSITLTAGASAPYSFSYWKGVGCSVATCQFNLFENKTVTAVFVRGPTVSSVLNQDGGALQPESRNPQKTAGGIPIAISGNNFATTGGYEKQITINNTGLALTDYVVKVYNLNLGSGTCSSVRFLDSTSVHLKFWEESACNKYWVNVPNLPSGNSTIRVRYSTSGGTSPLSDGQGTFNLYDDFANQTAGVGTQPAGWYDYRGGDVDVASDGGNLALKKINQSDPAGGFRRLSKNITGGFEATMKVKSVGGTNGAPEVRVGLGDSAGNSYDAMINFGLGKGRLLYGLLGDSNDKQRSWNGLKFGDLYGTNSAAAGNQIVWEKVVNSPMNTPTNKREYLAGRLQTSNYHIWAKSCLDECDTEANWSASEPRGFDMDIGAADAPAFDIAYEQSSGEALAVWRDSLDGKQINYRVWSNGQWGAASARLTTGGNIRYMKLAPKPAGNTIALVWSDVNEDVQGVIWNGTTNSFETPTSSPPCQDLMSSDVWSFDAEWQGDGQKLLVACSSVAGSGRVKWFTYTPGSGWSVAADATGTAVETYQLKLFANPFNSSNKIGLIKASQSGTAAIVQPGMWDGSTSTLTLSSVISTTGSQYSERNSTDGAWLNDNEAIVVYINYNDTRIRYCLWTSGAWCTTDSTYLTSMDTGAPSVQVERTDENSIVALIHRASYNLWAFAYNRTSGWRLAPPAPITANLSQVDRHPFYFAPQIKTPPGLEIERRMASSPKTPTSLARALYVANTDTAYRVVLRKYGNNLRLELLDGNGNSLSPPQVVTATDGNVTQFDKFFVYGDKEFYVDDIRVRKYMQNAVGEIGGPGSGAALEISIGSEQPASVTVTVGGLPATVSTVVADTITIPNAPNYTLAPEYTGSGYCWTSCLVNVVVTNPDGGSGSCYNCMEYIDKPNNPYLVGVGPPKKMEYIPTGGGSRTIQVDSGAGMGVFSCSVKAMSATPTCASNIGGTSASVTATLPALPVGTYPLRVYGDRGTDENGIYETVSSSITYENAPAITSVEPQCINIGIEVTVNGSNFKVGPNGTKVTDASLLEVWYDTSDDNSSLVRFIYTGPPIGNKPYTLYVYSSNGTDVNGLRDSYSPLPVGDDTVTVTIGNWPSSLRIGRAYGLTGNASSTCPGTLTYSWTAPTQPPPPPSPVFIFSDPNGVQTDFTAYVSGAYQIKLTVKNQSTGGIGEAVAPPTGNTRTLPVWHEVKP